MKEYRPPRISLCMIVKDEAEMLPRFLEAARPLWDELVVVDTGSSDGTPTLAAEAGACVIRHAWTDDFAAARNLSLQAATGDFVLYLDADEIASPALGPALRAAAEDPSIGAATLRMRNEMPNGHYRLTPLLRFFRRHDQIRFRHRIHEEVATTVRAYLRRTARRMVDLEAEVLHLGYTRDRAAARNKKQRDLKLLEAGVAEDPMDYYSWFKMLELARFWNDAELGRRKAQAVLALLAKQGPSALRYVPFGGELISLAVSAFLGAQPAAAGRLMDTWRPMLIRSAAFHLRRGELAEESGDLARAREEFERCLSLDAETADRQLATVRPMMGLARLAIAAGRLNEAWQHIERALSYNPIDPETVMAAVVVCGQLGGDSRIRELIATYTERYGDPAPITRALAELTPAAAG